MTVRSTKLGYLDLTAGTQATLFTCPAGWRAILKDLRASVGTAPPFDIQVWVINQPTSDRIHLLWQTGVTTNTLSATGGMVLNPGDLIQCYCAQQPVRFWASGTLLQLTGQEPM